MSATADEVASQLRRATKAVSALPVFSAFPSKGGRSCLYIGDASPDDVSLTPAQVDAVLAVADWPSIITDPRERRLVRLRADGHTWRQLGEMSGLSHMGAKKVCMRGVTRIARAINYGKITPPPAFHLSSL